MCDVFEHAEAIDAESFPLLNHWYADLTEKAFLEQYGRFHEQPPDVIVGASEDLDVRERAGTCRIVHVDGGHTFDIVRRDVSTARRLLGPGGIVAFGNVRPRITPAWPWRSGSWCWAGRSCPSASPGPSSTGRGTSGAVDWVAGIDEWVAQRTRPRDCDVHTLAGLAGAAALRRRSAPR